MKAIHPLDYDMYITKKIFKYQFFQTFEVFIAEPIAPDDSIDYYITEDLAKQRQAYELHRMMSGTYKGYNRQEGQISHFFKRFIDERDIEFFVSTVSKNQMNEEEYFKYLSQVEEEFPEKLI